MSLMQQYSDIYCIPMKEIKEWVNDFANGNVPESVKEWMSTDKTERIESIKSYIQSQVDDSTTGRVKADIQARKIEKSIPKEVDICPFN